ncbi:cytochrome oxidase assembly [Patellaria atrata CBS 101060]|uniref:Cytochrome oxidase assembly n=1 Tax=Patellaria atrata CBS 101060 TaxID=1346257 RepID=A0A9P4VRB1_9PEZI|nr:cytochrome oxidase assembly [Patellaria atrata CBS 101060]
MLQRTLRPRCLLPIRPLRHSAPRRTLIPPPTAQSGPLLERRPDRALPDISSSRRWLKTIPLFILILGSSTLAIFNYQKSSSSVVSSTLYALRTNPQARELLGDEIYFASAFPWIWGTMDQLHGKIDIRFAVKGSRRKGEMRFRSARKSRMGYFKTLEWSLTLEDGRRVELLQPEQPDPFGEMTGNPEMNAAAAS